MNDNGVTIIQTGCCHDCGGRCVLRAHVKDGKIIRFETDKGAEPQLRACLRGRAYRQRLYSPDRLKYPLHRTGERGEGKFERISWDGALNAVAGKLKETKEKYGNSAILLLTGAGNQGLLHGARQVTDLLLRFGGFTMTWGSASFEAPIFASLATYGTLFTGNSREDLLNSRLVIGWGWNPVDTIQDTGTSLLMAKVKEKGIPIVIIDPRYTDSAAAFADQWIPIRPGTDASMLIAMAYVIITENLQDQAFIDKFTTGFDKFKEYVLGKTDRTPKTPQWASEISTVPSQTIIHLAREYATNKPAALIAGWGPARSAMGEQYCRAANALTSITGNIGINGGFAAGFMRSYSSPVIVTPPEPKNAVEQGFPPRKNSLHRIRGGRNPTSARIHRTKIYDAILRGRAGGYPADIKMAYIVASNFLNQTPNVNYGIKALKALDFLVIQDQFMTPTAKFADILLPVNTFMERDDIAPAWEDAPNYVYLNKAVESMYESKSDREICRELAKKLGIVEKEYEDSDDQRLRAIAGYRKDIPDYDRLKQDGSLKITLPEPIVSFKRQLKDFERNPFPTLSGTIEIYSDNFAEMNNPAIPAVPGYISPWENYDDPLAKKYPLQLVSSHSKVRAHSTWHNVPWLLENQPHTVWINASDAAERGIKDGDLVDVFNSRGRVRIKAQVTERIMPGVVNISEGAWYDPDMNGIDRGGCANSLTRDEPSPGGAFPANTALVQVELSPQ